MKKLMTIALGLGTATFAQTATKSTKKKSTAQKSTKMKSTKMKSTAKM